MRTRTVAFKDSNSLSRGETTAVRWVTSLYAMVLVLQRIAVPGLPVAILVPITIGWVGLALMRGIVEVDKGRLGLWLAMASATAAVMPVEARLVPGADISIGAWGLVVAVWLPFTVRLVGRTTSIYLAALRNVVVLTLALACVSFGMILIQILGVTYVDWVADFLPRSFQLQGFVISYPVSYGSALYKSNAFIGLEPSTISFQIGVGLLAAVYIEASPLVAGLMILGLASTVSGSGIFVLAVGLSILLARRAKPLIKRYFILATTSVIFIALSPIGPLLFSRSTEFESPDSSTSLRAIQPYGFILPSWQSSIEGIVFGYGPGSATRLVNSSNIEGLLVPTPIKVFYEYGVLGGIFLAIFVLMCYWGGPASAISMSILASLWFLQPGLTTSALVYPLLLIVTIWSPMSAKPMKLLSGRHLLAQIDRGGRL